MNDSKFIELLNLYVDHQIGATEAALLEAEIQRSPERRRIYRQYCQMQKACTILAENFRAEAPASGTVLEFEPARRRRIGRTGLAFGAMAAAACLTFIVVNRTPPAAVSTGSLVAVADAVAPAADFPAEDAASAASPVATLRAERVALQPVFAGFDATSRDADFAAGASSQVRLDWMDRIQLRKVTTEELWLEQRPSMEPQDLLFRSSTRHFQGPVEMTAWRFQK